jgi:hypothetical protein
VRSHGANGVHAVSWCLPADDEMSANRPFVLPEDLKYLPVDCMQSRDSSVGVVTAVEWMWGICTTFRSAVGPSLG